MNPKLEKYYLRLAEKEGWQITKKLKTSTYDSGYDLNVNGRTFPLCHPFQIHITLYRDSKDSLEKYKHMKASHDYLWPHYIPTWNYWEERRFHAHCQGYSQIIMAGGASSGKSLTAAKIAFLFWLANPKHRGCVIASTTLESLESRIWGYVVKLLKEAKLPLGCEYLRSKPPKIVNSNQPSKIYGMFAIAIQQGEDIRTLSTTIGRHPEDGLLVVLDEATDITPAIIQAIPNLEKGTRFFQLWAIGNSNSKNDTHGSLATPKNGWDSINPERDYVWETTHKNSICLYFNPYDSPAIKETDLVKKERLKFLITEDVLAEDEKKYGKDSDSYYRFTLGFWKKTNLENTLVSEQFLNEHQIKTAAEWSGLYPINIVAGLDPAFSSGNDSCILRLAVLGHSTNGLLCLDFRNTELLYKIGGKVSQKNSVEYQIAEQIIEILRKYNCPISSMALDATGSGRALGELIKIISGEPDGPFRIISTGGATAGLQGFKKNSKDPSIYVATPIILWSKFREFIQRSQIKGLDFTTMQQLTTRLLVLNPKTNKQMLESKMAYKARMNAKNPSLAHSPDEADAAILCLHAAMLKFGFHPGQEYEMPKRKENDMLSQKLWEIQQLKNLEHLNHTEERKQLPVLVSDFTCDITSFGEN